MFLTNSGSESVDTALNSARYHRVRGTGRGADRARRATTA